MATFEELREREIERMNKAKDPEEERLGARIVASLLAGLEYDNLGESVYGPYRGLTVEPNSAKRETRISIWTPNFMGDLVLTLVIGREYIREVYAPRKSAERALDIIYWLQWEGYAVNRHVEKATERWEEGRTLASKGFDYA
jgi:hypothetical protein